MVVAAPAVLFVLLSALCAAGGACAGESRTAAGGPAPPPGAGYGGDGDDVRTLSRDDCLTLRDRQIELAVASAAQDAGPGAKLTIESEVRAAMRSETDQWLKRCAGRVLRAKDWRCMKDAITLATFLSCGDEPTDAGADARDSG